MVDSPEHARNKLAGLHSRGAVPHPDAEAAARTNLATSKIDKAIRDSLRVCPKHLDDSQIGHLVGLILNESGIDGETSTRVERDVRAAIVASHKVTAVETAQAQK
jgi:hypothetical protein